MRMSRPSSRARAAVYGVPSCAVTDHARLLGTGRRAAAVAPARRRGHARASCRPRSGAAAELGSTRAITGPVLRPRHGPTCSRRHSAADEIVPFNNVRRRAATALLASKRTAPHALAVVAVDYTGSNGSGREAGLTALPFVARAVDRRAARVPAAQRDGRRRRARRAPVGAPRDRGRSRLSGSRRAGRPRRRRDAPAQPRRRDPGRRRRGPGRSSSGPTIWPAARSRSPIPARPARGCRSRS